MHASLSTITFLIGGNLEWSRIKKLGKTIAIIILGEAELSFILVTAGMILLLVSLGYHGKPVIASVLLFGALASPTDPAATLAVIHEYKAKGILQ